MYCSNLSNSKEVVDLDWEKLATTAVEASISKTERLSSFINSGDKEPAWDGNIYIHSDSKHSKKDIKKVATQVKGKGVSAKVKSTIKYPVSATDLKAYMHNGGTMFFVVYIDKGTGETKQIYYSALTPFKIMEIMKEYINNYINFYLENDDELTLKNEEKYRRIQQDENAMNRLATELGNLKLVDMQDINYEISRLLEKEI